MKFPRRKRSTGNRDHRLHFVLDEHLYDKVHELAARNQRSVCGMVKHILIAYLESDGQAGESRLKNSGYIC
jgi:molybdopterin-guanine dinucleotide biosynthesis protein A